MIRKEIEEINVDDVWKQFEQHLAIKGNNRIIFSGPFGTGKTWFLNRFFEKTSDRFNTVVINPVKYSVSNNKDIFELIKADVIVQLFEKGYVKTEKSSHSFKGQIAFEWFLYEKWSDVLAYLSEVIGKIRPDQTAVLSATLKGGLGFWGKFKSYRDAKAKDLKIKPEHFDDFIEMTKDIKGNVLEEDFITLLIQQILEEIKGDKEPQKENVLIVDDFDRMDPEHIFRILNVLSVHNDHWNGKNKFGFDKIIIVCDIENIRKIFEYKYGKEVDFRGYLDKFHTAHFFRFNNEVAIKAHIFDILRDPQCNDIFTPDNDQEALLIFLLSYFLGAGKITLRQILKSKADFSMSEFIFDTRKYLKGNRGTPWINSDILYIQASDIHILSTLRICAAIWGDFLSFYKDIEEAIRDDAHFALASNRAPLRALALAKIILTNADSEKYVLNKVPPAQREMYQSRMEIPAPIICGLEYKINLGFNSSNPYLGNISYYADAKIFERYEPHHLKFKEAEVGYRNFFYDLKEIIDGMLNCDTLTSLDLTLKH